MNVLTRRTFLGAGLTAVAMATGSALAQQPAPAQPAPRVKGPAVWLDMDQAELDAAYDQAKYAPNLSQIVKRYATNSEDVRARLGAPRRYAYGPTPIEALDVYTTKRTNAPINVFIHGGAWRAGLARDSAYPAELFVHAGAHYPRDAGQSLRAPGARGAGADEPASELIAANGRLSRAAT
jgi:arylformamidase